jgi:cell division protein FtsQ
VTVTTSTRPPRPSIDPRIKERRIAVQRDEGRRRLRLLIVVMAVLALAGAGVGATRSPLLDVDRVLLTGNHHVGPTEALRTAGITRGDLMVDVDLDGARHQLEALAWVARATVTRKWPSTVTVRIMERQPAAAVPAPDGHWATVDRTGRVLEVTASAPAGLALVVDVPPVTGPRAPDALQGAITVARAIPARLLPRVPAVVAMSDGIELRLAPSGRVRFGPAEQVGEKLAALETLLDRVHGPLGVVDVRVPDAPVLTRT